MDITTSIIGLKMEKVNMATHIVNHRIAETQTEELLRLVSKSANNNGIGGRIDVIG